jgi:hypothetical protein
MAVAQQQQQQQLFSAVLVCVQFAPSANVTVL